MTPYEQELVTSGKEKRDTGQKMHCWAEPEINNN